MKPFLPCIVSLMTLSACASPETRRQDAFTIAQRGGLQPFEIDTGVFGLKGFHKKGAGDAAVLHTALDPAPNVFYLARPCQYVDLATEPNCSDAYWSTARFAPEVIGAFDRALDRIGAENGMQALARTASAPSKARSRQPRNQSSQDVISGSPFMVHTCRESGS